MTDMRRMLKCSNCGKEVEFSISTQLNISELQVFGKCPDCGGAMQINFHLIEPQQVTAPGSEAPREEIKLDETIMPVTIPGDDIKSLIEE
ncbi:MAG: hypothetical protein ACP5NX_01200 [Candidatus Bilamarchaeaceae archaeon]